MKHAEPKRNGKPALDLIEEAAQCVRTAPLGTLAVYFAGGVPFVLGLLFFWTDMSRSPYAAAHVADGSLAMAALFLWMKFCHVIFARRMLAHVTGSEVPPLGFRRAVRIAVTQAIWQPSGLFFLPLAMIPLLPFAWVYAFYQNITVLDEGESSAAKSLWKKAVGQAGLWGMQNQFLVLFMVVFAAGVWVNWIAACAVLPELVRMLFGIQSDFSRSQQAMLNSTFLAAMFGLTYLSVDPILKTIYVLRCFYGQSLQSGEDLKAGLKPFAGARRAIAILIVSAAAFLPLATGAEGTNPPVVKANTPAMSPDDLDHTINQTIQERKYVWRMPRAHGADTDEQQGVIGRFFTKIQNMIRSWLHHLGEWLRDWWRRMFPHRSTTSSRPSGGGWIEMLNLLLYCLIAVVVLALIYVIVRLLRERQKNPAMVTSVPIESVPDLADENVRADQLPEDGWIKLANELLERGEFRLAMRAFYLSGLAHLAGRNLVSIARFKSNRDYERELRRRAHAIPVLVSIFDDNLFTFERIWYGMHEVNRDLVGRFATEMQRMKTSA